LDECALERFLASASEVEMERVRGARWALYTLARGLVEDAEEGADICACLKRIKETIHRVSPTMVPPHWIPRVLEEACKRGASPVEPLRSLIDYQQRSLRLLVESGSHLVRAAGSIITISNSSTVEALILSSRRVKRVIIAESRPGGEGVHLARSIAAAGLHVEVVPDSAVAGYISPGSIVLLGADAVTGDGCVYNKVGSLLLAASAKSLGASAYAVFDATKIEPDASCGQMKVPTWAYEVEGWGTIRVPVFEPVRPELLSGYITEMGLLVPGGSSIRGLVERLLDHLI
jgi:translation initiation factor 2B subunit (eIF-2B alpha/beta/delta family)